MEQRKYPFIQVLRKPPEITADVRLEIVFRPLVPYDTSFRFLCGVFLYRDFLINSTPETRDTQLKDLQNPFLVGEVPYDFPGTILSHEGWNGCYLMLSGKSWIFCEVYDLDMAFSREVFKADLFNVFEGQLALPVVAYYIES